MKRVMALLGVSLACAALLGALAPALIVGAIGSAFPNASDMADNALFFPGICLFYVIGPIAAGLAANRIAGSVMSRLNAPSAIDAARTRMEARAAGVLATTLSWILIVQGSIYSVFDLYF